MALAAIYLLIYVGGLVRVSGAGLGCPDWPRCFDRWIPPTDISQLPADVSPVLFNVTLAWIEYVNRIVGVWTGLVVFAMAWAGRHTGRATRMKSWSAFAVVAIQGWLGSVVVESNLAHGAVTLHLLLALVAVGLLISLVVDESPVPKDTPRASTGLLRGTAALTAVCLMQIWIGAEVRGEVDIVRDEWPLLSDVDVVQRLGEWVTLHSLIAVGMVIGTWHVTAHVFNERRPIRAQGWTLVFLILLQMVLGMAMFSAGVLPILQIVHQWISCLYFGILVWITLYVRKGPA